MIIFLLVSGWLLLGFAGILIATKELQRDVSPTRWTFFFEDYRGFVAVGLGLLTFIVAALRYVGLTQVESGHFRKIS